LDEFDGALGPEMDWKSAWTDLKSEVEAKELERDAEKLKAFLLLITLYHMIFYSYMFISVLVIVCIQEMTESDTVERVVNKMKLTSLSYKIVYFPVYYYSYHFQ